MSRPFRATGSTHHQINNPFDMTTGVGMSKALYTVVSSKFHNSSRMALFFDYKDACKCDKDVSKKLRELNRYDSINVALVLCDSNDKSDDDAIKLTTIDMPHRKYPTRTKTPTNCRYLTRRTRP
jgi:hypothetical protein